VSLAPSIGSQAELIAFEPISVPDSTNAVLRVVEAITVDFHRTGRPDSAFEAGAMRADLEWHIIETEGDIGDLDTTPPNKNLQLCRRCGKLSVRTSITIHGTGRRLCADCTDA
jgi:hypothetical protein